MVRVRWFWSVTEAWEKVPSLDWSPLMVERSAVWAWGNLSLICLAMPGVHCVEAISAVSDKVELPG